MCYRTTQFKAPTELISKTDDTKKKQRVVHTTRATDVPAVTLLYPSLVGCASQQNLTRENAALESPQSICPSSSPCVFCFTTSSEDQLGVVPSSVERTCDSVLKTLPRRAAAWEVLTIRGQFHRNATAVRQRTRRQGRGGK